jgi:hypothetical protein
MSDPRDPTAGDGDDELVPPPMSDLLEGELRHLAPVSTRRPFRDAGIVAIVAGLVVLALVGILHVRRDLDAHTTTWLVAYGGAWIAAFVAGTWLALVPKRGATRA